MEAYFMGAHVGGGHIVDTDYENYLIGYSCEQLDEGRKHEKIGIQVRDPNISEEEAEKLVQKLSDILQEA